jgi:hypothetical protein
MGEKVKMNGIADSTAPGAEASGANSPQSRTASVAWVATRGVIAVMATAAALVTVVISAADSAPAHAAGFGEVSGCVRLADGRFVAGANMQLVLAALGEPASVYRRGALTDQQGCSAFVHLPARTTDQARSCNSFNGGHADVQKPLSAGHKQNQDVYLVKY